MKVVKKKYPEEHLKVARKMVDFPQDILKRVLADQKAVRGVCSHITAERYWKGPFIWPVNSKILSPFGLRRFFNGQPRSPHSGVDLRAKDGVPIVAPNNGRIVLARDCYLSGNTLVIDHGGGLYTLYAHLSQFKVKRGAMVKKGQTIGLAGSTGRVTGPHLHWGVSLLGTRVDPQMFMTLAENYFSSL
jgi:murein DD-endopeptidase MepM/ murein hydrolase activator NlpD